MYRLKVLVIYEKSPTANQPYISVQSDLLFNV